ncbi:hypothetical protein WR25_05700 isoform B [Diploscapter pachys]|uniref:RING-CH-type domain-containing protein n=1 Tax=Diploscapter pachys TaxID=2018661 RepID=A0A2A2L0N6_9BILA|nr:hypothetical protein WR25_05700 isoform B [Diploscapter pachys]
MMQSRIEQLNEDVMKENRSETKLANQPIKSPPKSVTFHTIQELKKHGNTSLKKPSSQTLQTASGTVSVPVSQLPKRYYLGQPSADSHSQPRRYVNSRRSLPLASSFPTVACQTRKRSLLSEMGERIRLLSTGSFVQAVVPSAPSPSSSTILTTAQSLNSFTSDQQQSCSSTPIRTGVVNSKRCSRARISPREDNKTGSIVSLNSHHEYTIDIGDSLLEKTPSQLGMLCQHCSTTDIPCPKAQQEMMRSPSVPSLYSLAPSSLSGDPLCRICHCCWPSDSNDPLISPCRCSGSLQYVHVSCLMHWLDISSRKLHRPAVCELCLYKYRRRRIFKYREVKMPTCQNRDLRYYSLFVTAVVLMLLAAIATVVCFQLEKNYGLSANRTIVQLTGSPTASGFEANTEIQSTSTLNSGSNTGAIPSLLQTTSTVRDHSDERIESILSTVTLISAIVFFLSFFMAMYAHVKSGLSLCKYISLCWNSNLEWSIEEYKQSRDSQYLTKLEELRRKLHGKNYSRVEIKVL